MSNKRLYKSTVNCMLCGVCGGIGHTRSLCGIRGLGGVILFFGAGEEGRGEDGGEKSAYGAA